MQDWHIFIYKSKQKSIRMILLVKDLQIKKYLFCRKIALKYIFSEQGYFFVIKH